MLKQCKEEDFYQLRSVATGRLRPNKASSFLWTTFFISLLTNGIVIWGVYGTDYHLRPSWLLFANICLASLIIQLIIALFYSKETMAYRFQKAQSIFLSIAAFKMSIDMYASMTIISEGDIYPSHIKSTGFALFMGGLIYLIISTLRGIKRVQQGEFREGGKGLYDFKQSKASVSLPIIFGATMMGGSIARTLSNSTSEFAQVGAVYFGLLLAVILQYTMAFALPEFFLLTYCKLKFEFFHIQMPRRPLKETPRETLMAKKQAQQVKASKKGNQKKARSKKK